MSIDSLLDSGKLVVDASRLEVRLDRASLEERGEASVQETEVRQLASHLMDEIGELISGDHLVKKSDGENQDIPRTLRQASRMPRRRDSRGASLSVR